MLTPGDILDRVSDGFVALDTNWRYVYLNRQAAALFGREPSDLIGRHIWTEFPEGRGQPFQLAYEKAMAEQVSIQMENYYEPWNRWFENRIYPAPDGLSIFFHEITERKLAEQAARESARLLEGQHLVLELIASGAPLRESLETLLRVIEAHCPGMLCSILVLDCDGTHVRHGASPSLPESFTRAFDGQPIGESAGSCGTAAFRRAPVVVEDIATDPLWERYRDHALAHGLRACWSTPIFDERQRVLGTFALYFRTPSRPTDRHLRLVDLSTEAAAIAISRHRENEVRLASQERHRLAVTGGQVGIWEWTVGTNRLVCNHELKSMFGWPSDRDDVTYGTVMDAIHQDDRIGVQAALRRALDEGASFDEEYRIVRPDGAERWIAVKGRAEHEASGAPRRMIGVALDVTDRRRAETQRRESEQRFDMVARATHDALWDWDLASDHVWWNRGITSVFGYAVEHVSPHAEWRSARIHPDDLPSVTARMRNAMDAGDALWSGEYRFRRADGSYADVLDRGVVTYDGLQRPIRMIGAMDDISERKRTLETLEERVETRTGELQEKNRQLEREIGQRMRAEQLLRARNDELKGFAYTVSHDLKAPLRGIAGYAAELDRRHSDGLGERARHCLRQILAATHNLDRLIEDLLEYARLDAQSATTADVDLVSLVETILNERQAVIVDQRATVATNLAATRIRGWQRGLQQVLTNLIDDALKYSRRASPPAVEVTSESRDNHVVVAVRDNGIGFDMKYHDRIFGLFERLVRQEDFEGTGAGLAIVKKVVDKMGGRIWAESAPGAGATFFVDLPQGAAAVAGD
jgi:PAS domain S-box-containing protein